MRKEAIEGRSKKRIAAVCVRNFVYDLLAMICAPLFIIMIFITIFTSVDKLIMALVMVAIFIPVVIRTVLVIRLRHHLYHAPSTEITLEKPRAKVKTIWLRRAGSQVLGINISGERGDEHETYFVYPVKDGLNASEGKTAQINGKPSVKLRVIMPLKIVDVFHEE